MIPASAALTERALRRLRRPLLLTTVAVAAERGAQAFWPAWTAVLGCYAFLAFADDLSGLAHNIALAVSALLISATLLAGLMRFRWPRQDETRRRLDQTLPGRPVAALTDAQAVGASDPGSVAVWNAHLRRMARSAAAARPPAPAPQLSARDRFGLRHMALTAFALAVVFAPVPSTQFQKGLAVNEARAGLGPGYEAWVVPPEYTRLPGIYLNNVADSETVSAPEFSLLTVRSYGDPEDCAIVQNIGVEENAPDGADPLRRQISLRTEGEMRIGGPGCENRSWRFRPYSNAIPEIRPAGPMQTGFLGQLRQPLELEDDFGIANLSVTVELDLDRMERRHGLSVEPDRWEFPPIAAPLPFGGSTTAFTMEFSADFSAHPWVGLPVTMNFVAEDHAGARGRLALRLDRLPGRIFLDPFAAAFAEQRRNLVWSENNAGRVAEIARALTHRPMDSKPGLAAYLLARTAIRGLENKNQATPATEAAELFWRAALHSEDTDLLSIREQMRRAGQLLEDAIRDGRPLDEIARLAELYRQAADRFLQELQRTAEAYAESGNALPNGLQPGQNAREVPESEIRKMMRELERLLAEGRHAEAEQLLSAIRGLLENTVASVAEGSPQGTGAQRSVTDFSDTLQRQQGLADEAFRELEEWRRLSGAGRSEGNVGGSGGLGSGQDHFGQGAVRPGTADKSAGTLAGRQEALRQSLRRQMRALTRHGGEGRSAMDEFEAAARAMTSARDNLRTGEYGSALEDQQKAMRNLADGIRSLLQETADERNSGYGGPPGSGFTETDPFGRRVSGQAGAGFGDQLVPSEIAAQRSRELRDEIRRRTGEAERPDTERDYLLRLLGRF